MRTIVYTFSFILVASYVYSQQKADMVIAFGSCSRQNAPEQLWKDILKQNPEVWIWGGDNIYGDTHNMHDLQQKYTLQKSHADYHELLKQCKITGTWDDHDYGVNDGGKFFSGRDESKKLMTSFLDLDEAHPVYTHPGVYHSYTHGKGKQKVKILNLDTRYFRDTLTRVFSYDDQLKDSVWNNVKNTEGDILGEAQWSWLEEELKNSNASLHLINSSIQVIAEDHRFEKWANFPKARKRLLDLLRKYEKKRILIISGDGHIAEISQIPFGRYPLVDFTSSGLTHTWQVNDGSMPPTEANRHRVGDLIIKKNFGVLRIHWRKSSIDVQMEIRGKDDAIFQSYAVSFPK